MALGRPLGFKNALANAQNGSRTSLGTENTLFLPYQTHLGTENTLFLPTKRARLLLSDVQAPPSTLALKIWHNFFSDENRTINTPLKSILDHWRPPGHP